MILEFIQRELDIHVIHSHSTLAITKFSIGFPKILLNYNTHMYLQGAL